MRKLSIVTAGCTLALATRLLGQQGGPSGVHVFGLDSALPGVAHASTHRVALTPWARQHGAPAFAEFQVPLRFHGSVAPPDTRSTQTARRFRTAIRNGAQQGPNFADRFTVVSWGCGSPCHNFVIVDAGTGRVYDNDLQLVAPPMWRRDSRLLVEDPTGFETDSAGRPIFPYVRYWEWTGSELRLVRVLNADSLGARLRAP